MQKSSTNLKRTQIVLRNKKILKNAQPNTDIVIYAYLSVSLKRASYKYTNNACHYQRGKLHCFGGKKASFAYDR